MHYYSDFFVGQKVVCTKDDHSGGLNVLTVTGHGPNVFHLTVIGSDGIYREICEHFIIGENNAIGKKTQRPTNFEIMDRVYIETSIGIREGVITSIGSEWNHSLPKYLQSSFADIILEDGAMYKKSVDSLIFKSRWVKSSPSD